MEAFDKFELWLAENGVVVNYDHIQFVNEDVCHGYGVRAKGDLSVGNVVCTIPKSAALSIRTSPLAEILEKEEITGGIGLAIALLRELSASGESHWKEYLQTLPEIVPLPLIWQPADLEKLKGTVLEQGTTNELEHLRADFDLVVKPLVEKHPVLFPKPVAFEDYLHAVSLVSSRAFFVDGYHGDSMVPVADIFNHRTDGEHVHIEGDDVAEVDHCEEDSNDDDGDSGKPEQGETPANAQRDKEKESLDIRVVRPAKAGDEVFNTFGDLPNSGLLSKYGFAEPDNAHDTAFMPLDLVRAVLVERVGQSAIEQTLEPLWEANPDAFGPDGSDAFEVTTDGSVNEALMLRLYSAHVTDGLRTKWVQDNVALMEHVADIDMNHILDVPGVCDTVTELFKARVGQYPPGTALDSDLKLINELKKRGLPRLSDSELKEYFSLLVRCGERRVLKEAYESVFDVSGGSGGTLAGNANQKANNGGVANQKRHNPEQGRQGKKKRRR